MDDGLCRALRLTLVLVFVENASTPSDEIGRCDRGDAPVSEFRAEPVRRFALEVLVVLGARDDPLSRLLIDRSDAIKEPLDRIAETRCLGLGAVDVFLSGDLAFLNACPRFSIRVRLEGLRYADAVASDFNAELVRSTLFDVRHSPYAPAMKIESQN